MGQRELVVEGIMELAIIDNLQARVPLSGFDPTTVRLWHIATTQGLITTSVTIVHFAAFLG